MDGNQVTLSVSISGTPQQKHLGFEVIDGTGVHVYHLASHCYYLIWTPEEYRSRGSDYMRVEMTNLSEHEMEHIFSHLKAIHSRNGRYVPYGFNFVADSVLTLDGDVPANLPAGAGLTCATFVLQVLRNQAFHIIDVNSWQPRADDAQWQRDILDGLRQYIPPEHCAALERCIGVAVRYRPEEVAGCARAYDEDPIQFPAGVVLGTEVCEEMVARGYMAG